MTAVALSAPLMTGAFGAKPVLAEIADYMILSHPNFTGLQIDPISHGYTPARFVNRIDIAAKGRPIVSVEGGIGVSEDPNFRFTLAATDVEAVTFAATDTEGAEFAGEAGME